MKDIIFSQISKDDLVNEIADRVSEIMLNNTGKSEPEDLLTCRQVEDLFDISHTTRIDWTNKGILPRAIPFGRRKYYSAAEIKKVTARFDHLR